MNQRHEGNQDLGKQVHGGGGKCKKQRLTYSIATGVGRYGWGRQGLRARKRPAGWGGPGVRLINNRIAAIIK
ncbi:hypothetical protein GCM10022409_13390 [Hymenobacter glaciei]|uniref:Uncharacterized protein n=1 Tax=Hymenobacter glaciei TaxID=877209 RepID=A0ABP7TSP5_9BACT